MAFFVKRHDMHKKMLRPMQLLHSNKITTNDATLKDCVAHHRLTMFTQANG